MLQFIIPPTRQQWIFTSDRGATPSKTSRAPRTRCGILLLLVSAVLIQSATAQKPKPVRPIPPIVLGKGKLIYNADTATGDRVPDYSYCGYRASNEGIPMVPVKVVVPLVQGDATTSIQHAIDQVAQLPLDKNGFRGTVLLSRGTYELGGQLRMAASGVVLRGFGAQGQTVIQGKGIDRSGLIRVLGINDQQTTPAIDITQAYVPVGAHVFEVSDASGLRPGDAVQIKRPSTQEWIDALGTESFGGGLSSLGWKAGDIDLYFDRNIIAIEGNRVTIDVPLTTSLDEKYGGGTIAKYRWPGRIRNIGIENLTLVSDYDQANPKDEQHRWMAITFDNTEDAWVRQLSFKHFAGSAVYINETVRRVTIEDCIVTDPVSEIGGERRNTFFTRGQQTLFQRCFSIHGGHDYSVGHAAAGPNAFVQCVSQRPFRFSGTVGSWASGVLFDIMQVDGHAIRVGNRGQDGMGAGWSGANCFFWNCSADLIECDRPPTAQNWSYGSWSAYAGKGYWAESNNHMSPRSFYYLQLAQRLQKDVDGQAAILDIGPEASTSPSVEAAQQLTKDAASTKVTMQEWIIQAAQRNPISTDGKGAQTIKPLLMTTDSDRKAATTGIQVKQGRILYRQNQALVTGSINNIPWWGGGVEGKALGQARPKLAITRFVPGRTGPGLTDDLGAVADSMKAKNIVGINQHYGLWYDRRRDDHERVRRMTGDVWAPFYELPFARSGKDSAWDGLSKYDLTKYNGWYWSRMKQFATLAQEQGLVLLYQNYFQHNIIEAGAHYADFPWRTANNINHTGFVEPVNYAGDKRIFYAEQFYDLSNPERNKLHQLYIEQSLNNFKDVHSVIQFTSEEYTGPFSFVAFWLETIRNWEQKNKQHPLIALSATKDVQDAVLIDPKLAAVVDIIDIKYWHRQADGTIYAPEGGKNLAPRQWARLLKPKASSFQQVYQAVKEYRDRYPEKAVMYSGDGNDRYGWAVFMAGGSLPVLPKRTDKALLTAAATMVPTDRFGSFALEGKNGIIIYPNRAERNTLKLDLTGLEGRFDVRFIETKTGVQQMTPQSLTGGQQVSIQLPKTEAIVWLAK